MNIQQLAVILIIFGSCGADNIITYQPEQIHLSLGGMYIINMLYLHVLNYLNNKLI